MGGGARGWASFRRPANAADFTEIRGMFHIRCRKRRRASSLPFSAWTFSARFSDSFRFFPIFSGALLLKIKNQPDSKNRPAAVSSLKASGLQPEAFETQRNAASDTGVFPPRNLEAAAPVRHEKRGTCVPLSTIFTPAWRCSCARRGPWWRPRRSCGYTDPWRRRASPSQWRQSGHCSSPPASQGRRRPCRWGSG